MKSYAMFTDSGNVAVKAIMDCAIENQRNFGYVLSELYKLSEVAVFAEATDTEVKECCYIQLEELGLA